MTEKSSEERIIERRGDPSENMWLQVPGDLDDLIFYDVGIFQSER